MTDILQSIFLGIVQGASEFLPISSSAHLILIPKIFNWQDQGLAFDVALHLGTLFAVLTYFFNDWKQVIASSPLFKINKSPRLFDSLRSDPLFIIIISTIPGALSGILLEKNAESVFRNPILIAGTLFLGGLILFYADRTGKKNSNSITLKKGLVIGCAQAFAIIPGISRSGVTIAAALIMGFDRVSAARFSFLLSTPIILGAGIKELPVLMERGIDAGLISGIVFASLSGYLAIKYMISYLATRNYDLFVAYRIILAIFIFISFMNTQ
ncbi:MAG: undecaprenyl-diphosphate phosphatase [Candidatus Paceibacterota bacterium]|jgi:undecaprenyl-diphosphatase